MSKIALITGTRKGIGRALAEHLLQQGWIVAGCSRRNSDIDSPNYHHYNLDIADEDAVVKMVRSIKRTLGPMDALINNAGIASMNHLLLTPAKTCRAIFETNVLGGFICMRECAKQMSRKKHGRIINFSTVAAPLNLEGEAIYAASKAAIESLTRTAAKELGSYGITVNAIGPTPIDTDLIRTVPKDAIDALIARQAIQRLGTIDDVINCVDFFLRDESAFISGQTLYLGGIS
ncbi:MULTISPECIES: SDR family NAD(P)-dependent oxidoreductase [unclassified Lentimonas]|uniref:SDR family NAD(P)-dependent oxidoreductase n=1 Tax=unclassified Lentimonas TaxID=2630993 RepID=UPI0013216C5D|nr:MULTISPECIES: SDR family oxidoreductase [unclassified Lentimonas]CAA6676772.1 3-oxoacyl-[acyl-carrier protein] reductase (EC [Lentimonas sp. CC4]CAA6684563.1 3-oxoacyl-[acyl-carrier protein] reductase (EC [Lentimonas sp. CC6]CAA7075199.1 3-oxoacyl-[acyl-carrier protein] reductase (EC [Lentimonas sp. CC4]CAA7170584.1 3-oxoacyl-[acyl-carrier protein] reductase (EC [Lentimonas sp. CC21]CAA7183208.1 3-oxoacyl-[acyl-carrier protein] reductase (EC [Lentimonas sp. CC8]